MDKYLSLEESYSVYTYPVIIDGNSYFPG